MFVLDVEHALDKNTPEKNGLLTHDSKLKKTDSSSTRAIESQIHTQNAVCPGLPLQHTLKVNVNLPFTRASGATLLGGALQFT